MEVFRKAGDRDERGGIHRQAGVLQADKRNEQADTNRNAFFERQRDGVENRLAHAGQRQDDKDNALDEYREQCDLPAVPIACNDRVCHKSVQAHACGQCKRQVGHQAHARRADKGRQRGRQQDRRSVHAGRAEDGRVDGKDISHGHKGRDTGHDLGFYVCFVFRQFEYTFKHRLTPFLLLFCYFPS